MSAPRWKSLRIAETPNDTARTITFNNPGIKPQKASNWDATVEYYFEPVGSSAQEFGAVVTADLARYGAMFRELNIQPD